MDVLVIGPYMLLKSEDLHAREHTERFRFGITPESIAHNRPLPLEVQS
jgi:hypothetical protein